MSEPTITDALLQINETLEALQNAEAAAVRTSGSLNSHVHSKAAHAAVIGLAIAEHDAHMGAHHEVLDPLRGSVIAKPYLVCPDEAPISKQLQIDAYAGSPNMYAIKLFHITLNGETQTLDAVKGRASYVFAPDALGKITIDLVAEDACGNISLSVAKEISVIESDIEVPVVTSPMFNERNLDVNPILTISNRPENATATHVQVAVDEDFTKIVFDETVETDEITIEDLKHGTVYHARAAWIVGEKQGPYSAKIRFTTNPASIISACQVTTGVAGQTWQRLDIEDNALPVNPDFDTHPVYRGISEAVIDGQQMIGIPKFFVQREAIKSGEFIGKDKRAISDIAYPGFELHPAFLAMDGETALDRIWIGKYAASQNGSKAASVPGVKPWVSITRDAAKTASAARNVDGVSGFHLWNIHEFSVVQVLCLLELASTDVRSKIGKGYISGGTALSTSYLRNVDEATVATASYRGIVGLWGHVWQILDGIKNNAAGNRLQIDMGKGYVDTSLVMGNSTFYPNQLWSISGDNYNGKHLFLGNTSGAASNYTQAAYLGQFSWSSKADALFLNSGSYIVGHESIATLFTLHGSCASNDSYTNTGFRIAKW